MWQRHCSSVVMAADHALIQTQPVITASVCGIIKLIKSVHGCLGRHDLLALFLHIHIHKHIDTQTHVQTNAENSTGHSVAASNFVIAGCACLHRCLQSFWLKRPLLALSGFSIAFDSCILVYSCEIWILVLIQFFLYFCVFLGVFGSCLDFIAIVF